MLKQIEKASSHSEEIYILGDINIDIKDGNISNITWKQVVELHDLQQLITDSTRVTAHSITLIGHLYVSNQGKIAEAFVPNVAISDHYPICFTRSTSKKKVIKGIITQRCNIDAIKSSMKKFFS